MEIELEKTFLLKNIPADLKTCPFIEISDIYVPSTVNHPILRIRKRGDKYEMTKKAPINENDSSEQYEKTIPLSKEEFSELSSLPGKRLRKTRYYCPWKNDKVKGERAEIDIYLDNLEGLATADFEFDSAEDKNNFKMPDFCLADVTQEEFCAAGLLAGKKYEDIELHLERYHYTKIKL